MYINMYVFVTTFIDYLLNESAKCLNLSSLTYYFDCEQEFTVLMLIWREYLHTDYRRRTFPVNEIPSMITSLTKSCLLYKCTDGRGGGIACKRGTASL